jgi:hypothetical protein
MHGVVDAHHRLAADGDDFADEALADGAGHVKEVDPDEVAFFDLGGVADELAGEGVDSGVVHDG